jgi:hypothetical protein
MEPIDNISADTIEVGDQILIDGDPIEVTFVDKDREDIDEVLIRGYSHESGDTAEYSLFADDYYDVWAV